MNTTVEHSQICRRHTVALKLTTFYWLILLLFLLLPLHLLLLFLLILLLLLLQMSCLFHDIPCLFVRYYYYYEDDIVDHFRSCQSIPAILTHNALQFTCNTLLWIMDSMYKINNQITATVCVHLLFSVVLLLHSCTCLALPRLALPCLALPCLALPCTCLALPCLALPCLALPCLALPCLALPCLALVP